MNHINNIRQERLDNVVSELKDKYDDVTQYYNHNINSDDRLDPDDVDDDVLDSFEIFCRFYPYTGQKIVLLTLNPRLDKNLMKYENWEIANSNRSVATMAGISQRYYMNYLSSKNRNQMSGIVNSLGEFFESLDASKVAKDCHWHPAEHSIPDCADVPDSWTRYFYPDSINGKSDEIREYNNNPDWPDPTPTGKRRESSVPWLDVALEDVDCHFFNDFYITSAYLPATPKGSGMPDIDDIPRNFFDNLESELIEIDPALIIPFGNKAKRILAEIFDINPVEDGHTALCRGASTPREFDTGISGTQGRLYQTGNGWYVIPMLHFNRYDQYINHDKYYKDVVGNECPNAGAYDIVDEVNGNATFYENCRFLSEKIYLG